MEKLKISPFFISSKFSFAKAENVVNPPQNPVANKSVWFDVSVFSFWAYPNISPIKRHPSILTVNVPKGKTFEYWFMTLATKYLKALPKPPPKKTNRKLFIIIIKTNLNLIV